jgi:hypothetical protein
MQDEFLDNFNWITAALEHPLTDFIPENSPEYAILSDFKNGWGKRDTATMLTDLTAKYGQAAGIAVEKYLALNITRDWRAAGETEAHPGTEIDDFIRILWQPLLQGGAFEAVCVRSGDDAVFSVTRCPIHELAKRTGQRQWLYHLACATDFYTTPAFSPRIAFSRTKTLILDETPCNHTYRRR